MTLVESKIRVQHLNSISEDVAKKLRGMTLNGGEAYVLIMSVIREISQVTHG